jgi:hypothetical protein
LGAIFFLYAVYWFKVNFDGLLWNSNDAMLSVDDDDYSYLPWNIVHSILILGSKEFELFGRSRQGQV